jgi:uncharacterized protein YcaQ
MAPNRSLSGLHGVGRATLADLALLQIHSVDQLARSSPDQLFLRLCSLTNSRQDPCVLDVLRCAVAQARDPLLPRDQCNWWFWTRLRKAGAL